MREKIADGGLIAKWRKPGYENLCSMLAIQKGDHNFGTTSLCRVPIGSRAGHQVMTPDVKIGCVSCASGDGVNGGPIWCASAFSLRLSSSHCRFSPRWNTPISAADLEKKSKKAGAAGAAAAGPAGPPGGAKRATRDEDEPLDEEVKKRLATLAAMHQVD